MSSYQGKFVWHELMTSDTESAEAFYRAVHGWRTQDAGLPDRRYTILSAGEVPVGGLMALTPEACEAGAKPGWIGYVAVDDVDAFAARVQAAGGAIHHPAEDIPGVGRFAVFSDPQGGPLVLFKALAGTPPAAVVPGTPGHVGWNELHTMDRPRAFAFYADLFGWTEAEAVDMGPMGIYQIFASGEERLGGMATMDDGKAAASWLYYVNVDTVDAAMARVKDHGGQVASGPHQVPGGSWIAHCTDPQGAAFALVGPKG